MSQSLLVDRHGHVGLVVMNRPPHNFLNYAQIGEIADACEELDSDGDIRAIVLAAEGRSFCAGADFAGGGVAPDSGDDAGEREVIGGSATLQLYSEGVRLFNVGIPIVAAVQGPAIGGGLGLAVAADFRITCPEARFCANFAALGIHQGFGLSVTLPDLLGRRVASRILLSAKRYKGDEAVEIGLADELVALEDVRDRALEFASEMAVNAPLALRSIRATLRGDLAERVAAITDHEAAEQARLSATSDAAEGARAVAERRTGNFSGN
ncbi:MAG: enoyl-CoA hydratase/isomerase family protein [Actinomycetia bacterium]|nr:enoyl-CoA hydratase/isomerase family protein [Actinomycetes bacterium]MCP4961180.1 enoyl-CoA hydratase/isomerase family protein [Actinomycetes bacterium]